LEVVQVRIRRGIPIVLLICLALSMQGCGGASWYVDFTTAAYIDDWKRIDWFYPWEGELHGTDGLWLDGKIFISPVGFDGDFTMDITLGIGPSAIVPLINFGFYYSSTEPLEWISFNFMNVGDLSSETYSVSENSPFRPMKSGSGPVGFRIGGESVFQVKKSGNNLTASINGGKFFSGSYTSYSYDTMFPVLNIDQGDYTYEVFIKSIRVEFSGNVYTWH